MFPISLCLILIWLAYKFIPDSYAWLRNLVFLIAIVGLVCDIPENSLLCILAKQYLTSGPISEEDLKVSVASTFTVIKFVGDFGALIVGALAAIAAWVRKD